MYYVLNKTTNRVVTTFKSREDARHFARANEGTVKSQAEFDALVAAGKVQAAQVELKTEPKVEAPAAEVQAPSSIMAMAEQIAKSTKTRVTIGAKAKGDVKKRVDTPEPVLTEARAFVATLTGNKVDTVRALARWTAADGTQLQRRDGLALLDGIVNPATVSTQWQLVRSGKLDAKAAE